MTYSYWIIRYPLIKPIARLHIVPYRIPKIHYRGQSSVPPQHVGQIRREIKSSGLTNGRSHSRYMPCLLPTPQSRGDIVPRYGRENSAFFIQDYRINRLWKLGNSMGMSMTFDLQLEFYCLWLLNCHGV